MIDRPTPPNGTAPRVLIIDDESGILETLRVLLRNEGFAVTTYPFTDALGLPRPEGPYVAIV